MPLVIDSDEAFGAIDDSGLPAGADGETHVFSFHVTKPFAVAEGGIVTTGDPEVADGCRGLINIGFEETRTSVVAGINGRCPSWTPRWRSHARPLRRRATRRRAQVTAISSAMSDLPLRHQLGSEGSTWQVLQVLVPDADARARALQAAERLGVEARACFDPPLHEHPAFAAYPIAGDLPNTRWLVERSLSLPMADHIPRRAPAHRRGRPSRPRSAERSGSDHGRGSALAHQEDARAQVGVELPELIAALEVFRRDDVGFEQRGPTGSWQAP